MEFYHKTVLLKETIDFLNINPDGIYVDATLGAGGLSSKILENLSSKGVLVSLDLDKDAVDFCKKKFKRLWNRKRKSGIITMNAVTRMQCGIYLRTGGSNVKQL